MVLLALITATTQISIKTQFKLPPVLYNSLSEINFRIGSSLLTRAFVLEEKAQKERKKESKNGS